MGLIWPNFHLSRSKKLKFFSNPYFEMLTTLVADSSITLFYSLTYNSIFNSLNYSLILQALQRLHQLNQKIKQTLNRTLHWASTKRPLEAVRAVSYQASTTMMVCLQYSLSRRYMKFKISAENSFTKILTKLEGYFNPTYFKNIGQKDNS